MALLNLFSNHLDSLNDEISDDKDQSEFIVKEIIPKFNNTTYLGGVLMSINNNNQHEKFNNFLRIIADSSYMMAYQKINIMKKFFKISSRLTRAKRIAITAFIWNQQGFRNLFPSFTQTMQTTSKFERDSGPFASLFSNEWNVNNLVEYYDAVKPLFSDETQQKDLLNYFETFTNLNYSYVDNIYQTEEKCSGVDFNVTMIYCLIKSKDLFNEDLQERFQKVAARSINVMFISLAEIKRLIYLQMNTMKSPQTSATLKMLYDRMNTIYNNDSVNEYISHNLDSMLSSITSSLELHNFLLYIDDTIKKGNPYTLDVTTSLNRLKNIIVLNDMGDSTGCLYVVLAYNNNTVDEKAMQKVVDNVAEMFKKGLNGMITLKDNIFMSYSRVLANSTKLYVTENNIPALKDMMINMNGAIVTSLNKQTIATNLLNNFLTIAWKLLSDIKTSSTGNKEKRMADILDMCTSCFVTLDGSKSSKKEEFIQKLIEMVELCGLTSHNKQLFIVKMGPYLTDNLKKKVMESKSQKEETYDISLDQFDKEKSIVNPVFVQLSEEDDNEMIIDSSTLTNDSFLKYVEGKTTIDEIKKYNKQIKIIKKKLDLLDKINIQKSS